MNDNYIPSFNDKDNQSPELMSFGEHLEEFRRYLIKIVIVVFSTFIILLFFKNFLFNIVILSPREPWFLTNALLCKLSVALNIHGLCINSVPLKLINIQLTGQFTAYMLVTFIASLILTFPYILWQLWLYVKPAFFHYEIVKFNKFISITSLLFITGVLFGYFIIVPLTINFLGTYKVSAEVDNTISLMSYISTVSFLTLIMGVVFQLPLFIYFISKAGLISPQLMRKNRKIVIVIILIISAVITPTTDAFSQLIVAIPLYFLYELSIFICRKQNLKSNILA